MSMLAIWSNATGWTVAQTTYWDSDFALSILPDLAEGFRTTIYVSLAAAVISLVGGLFFVVVRLSGIRFFSTATTMVTEFIRSTPVLVQLYFVFYVFPQYGLTLSAEVTGVGVLGIHYSTYMAEVYRAGINSVPQGQWDAAKALNLRITRTWYAIVLPQALPPMIPAMGNYLNEMFKATPILLAITIVELLATAQQIGGRTFRYFEALTITALMYLAVSLAASLLVQYGERRFSTTTSAGV